MPVSLMRNGLTAENNIFGQRPDVKYSRSRFDLSRLVTVTSDIGMIVPVDIFQTYPGDEFDLGCQYQIDFRPMNVTSLTSYKVKLHYYFCPNEYLWSGWESFITKGRSGSLSLQVPSIRLDLLSQDSGSGFPKLGGLTDPNFKTESGDYYPLSALSLPSLLIGSIPYDSELVKTGEDGSVSDLEGSIPDHYLPYLVDTNSIKSTGYKMLRTNALPFLMYQKIYRSNYMDPNLMSNGVVKSDVWFPDDIDSTHWRFNYASSNLFGAYSNYFVPDTITVNPSESSIISNFVPIPSFVNGEDDGDNAVNLLQLRYAMYNNDIFTTALPFLQRGPETSLDANVVGAILSGKAYLGSDGILPYDKGGAIPSGSFFSSPQMASVDRSSSGSILYLSGSNPNVSLSGFHGAGTQSTQQDSGDYVRPYINGSDFSVSGIQVTFTAQKLREMLALSVWQERNALTNGSYGQFVKVHFGDYPRNQFCEPIYIGGTTSYFNVSSVLQTSASTDGGTPQGNPTGIGASSNAQSLGHFVADDFGFIMALMMIVPDNVYSTTHEHWEFDLSPDDYFMPEYENLSYQPILNKQLFVTGVDATDNDLFGYSNRYVYLKQRDSVSRGRFALPSSVDTYYHSYVQSRDFVDTPALSQQFVTVYPPNIDRSFLAYTGEPAFLVQFYSTVNAVRRMAYVSQPNTFGF